MLWLHNLKKAKGQYTSFGIIIAITACIINIALVLAMQTGAAYDKRFQELNTADVNVIIPEAQHTASVRDSIAATDGVEDVEHRRASLASATVRDFAGADFDMTTVFYNIDDPRTLNTLAVERVAAEQDGVYVPEYMSEMGGFTPGSSITYAIDGTEHTYTVANTVGEMQYGNYGTGLIGAYLPPDAFEDFAARHGTVMEYSIRASDDADTQQLQSDIAAALADQGVTVLNTSNRVSAKQTRTMVCTLLVAIFLALAFIVLAVSVFLSNFRIRNTIANDMTQMGVLKALGYTSSMIIRSCVIPYALVGAVSAMVGAGLSYAVLPALAHVLAVQSGFSFTPTFDPVATAIAVLAPTGAIVIFAYVAARSIRRVEPINAIRGIRPNTATVNHFPLETTNMPVKTTLLAKRIASSAGTNILLGAVAVVVTLLMSFAGVLLYNVVIKPANLMDTLSEETPSVIFTAAPGKLGELNETLDADARTRTVLRYASMPVSYDGGNLTAFVSEDFSQVHNDIVYEGRNPATGGEIAVGSALSEQYPVGSEFTANVGEQSHTYTVTGHVQSVNNGGAVCELTSDGYEHLAAMPETLNVYLHEDGAEQFIDDYESRHGELVAASTNYEQLAKSGQSLYAGVMSVAAVMIVILAGLMVLLVLYIIINSMIVQRRQEFGIYKAIGWSSAQLARHTALSLVPVIALASLVAAGVAYAFMPQVMGSIFSMVGAMRHHFEVPMVVLMACVVLLALMSFAMSMALMRPVKKIMVYSLLKE